LRVTASLLYYYSHGSPDTKERDRDRDRSRRGDRPSRFSGGARDRSPIRERRKGDRRVYVSNVAYESRWQDIKDLFRAEGKYHKTFVGLDKEACKPSVEWQSLKLSHCLQLIYSCIYLVSFTFVQFTLVMHCFVIQMTVPVYCSNPKTV